MRIDGRSALICKEDVDSKLEKLKHSGKETHSTMTIPP
jgi:hypothetical protein